MRPTKNVPNFKLEPDKCRTAAIPPENWSQIENRSLEDKDEWKSAEAWVHWDLNPWKWTGTSEGLDYKFEEFICENNGSRNTGDLKLQGLISFSDSTENDGGFATVPGFHKNLKSWSESTKNTNYCIRQEYTYDYVSTPKGDPMISQLRKISSRSGSLIIWRSEQPHCNYPNNSNKFRINQYLKMFPAQPKGENVGERKEVLKKIIPKDLEITPLGKKLFGMENW